MINNFTQVTGKVSDSVEQIQTLSGLAWSTPAWQTQSCMWCEAAFSLLHLTPGLSKTEPRFQTDAEGMFPEDFPWGPYSPFS